MLDLHSHGVDFNQIVNQGLNPEILQTLYAEVGIQLSSSSPSRLQQAIEPGASTQNIAGEGKLDLKQTQSAPLMDHTSSPSRLALETVKSVASPMTSEKDERKSTINSLIVTAPKKSAGNTHSAKISSSKTHDVKPLDRKEYIARMLAAKATKPLATSNTSVPLKADTSKTAETAPPPLNSNGTANTSIAAPLKLVDRVHGDAAASMPHPPKDDISADAKRKAQTDLARQKIEALKLRQETPKVTPSGPVHQPHAIPSGIKPPALPAIPAMVNRPPAPGRQSSYFSPISENAPFSIPGLFMTTIPPETVKQSHEKPAQLISTSTKEPQQLSVPIEPHHEPASTSEEALTRISSSETRNEAEPDKSAMSATMHRKRQKAADFLDSPSIRIKRPLGQQENSSIIIDISDDDMDVTSDNDNVDIEAHDQQVLVSKKPQPTDSVNGRPKLLQDLPPLSGSPSQRANTITTGSILSMPTQAKGLKTKEIEIDMMNRKIAELEQRINAKRTNSRAQTPRASDRATVSPPRNKASQAEAEASAATIQPSLHTDSVVVDDFSDQTPAAFIEEADKLATEQKLHEMETEKAEAERSLAADVARVSGETEMLKQEQTQSTKDNEPVRFESEAESLASSQSYRIEQHETQDEQMSQDHDDELDRLKEGSHLQKRVEEKSLEEEQCHAQKEEQVKAFEEQRRMRKSAIESGLPILDATMERTKQKLEFLRREIEGLEQEVQKGVTGRKALVKELMSLSLPTDPQKSLDQENELNQSVEGPSNKKELKRKSIRF